ncbi:MAG: hypothetical protein BWY19_00277 [bacterium ADurb.Bin212]|nr:MAG: hypothetical protein BWY19_00277 [bacterium ADurb.Bin212]
MFQKRIFIVLFVFLMLVFPQASSASNTQNSSSGVTVLPAKFELNATPGEKISQSLRITNDDDHDYIYALSIDNVAFTGESGELIVGTSTPNLPNLLSGWVSFEKNSGILKAKSFETVVFNIDVPKDIEIGGKYASLVIGIDKIDRESGKSMGEAKIVSMILLTIAGGFEDNAKIVEFSLEKKPLNEFDFILRVRNHDVNHIKPNGSIVVSNILGNKVAEIPIVGDNVLPGSVRKTITKWQPEKKLFGYYTATIVAKYGTNTEKNLSGSFSFYVFPFWKTLLIIGLILFCLWISIHLGRKTALYYKRRAR